MNNKKFKLSWNASEQPRKQRLFRFNAPIHIRGKFLSAHLSKELRTKYGSRSARVRVGDNVKVMRGQFKGKVGIIERVDSKTSSVYITKVEQVKKDGSKKLYPINASNLLILELKLDDKFRVESLTKKVNEASKAPKVAKVATVASVKKPAAKTAAKPSAKKE